MDIANSPSMYIMFILKLGIVLDIVAQLLELDKVNLRKALTERKIEVRGSVTVIPLKLEQV